MTDVENDTVGFYKYIYWILLIIIYYYINK